jgi:hypothetical protein
VELNNACGWWRISADGACIAASCLRQLPLPLPKQALSSYKGQQSELNVQHLGAELQQKLLSAEALLKKYGNEGLINSLLRFEGKDDVEKKFNSLIRELQTVTNKVGVWVHQLPQKYSRNLPSSSTIQQVGRNRCPAFHHLKLLHTAARSRRLVECMHYVSSRLSAVGKHLQRVFTQCRFGI